MTLNQHWPIPNRQLLIITHVWPIQVEFFVMAKRCQITGKTVMSGNNVSHANNRTRRRFLPNLQSTRMHSEVLNRQISLRVSTSAMRTVEKHGGLDAYLSQARNAELAVEARELKREIAAAKLAK